MRGPWTNDQSDWKPPAICGSWISPRFLCSSSRVPGCSDLFQLGDIILHCCIWIRAHTICGYKFTQRLIDIIDEYRWYVLDYIPSRTSINMVVSSLFFCLGSLPFNDQYVSTRLIESSPPIDNSYRNLFLPHFKKKKQTTKNTGRCTKRPDGLPRGSSPRRCPKLGTPTRRTSQAGYHLWKSWPPMIPDPFKRLFKTTKYPQRVCSTGCPRDFGDINLKIYEYFLYSNLPSIVYYTLWSKCIFKKDFKQTGSQFHKFMLRFFVFHCLARLNAASKSNTVDCLLCTGQKTRNPLFNQSKTLQPRWFETDKATKTKGVRMQVASKAKWRSRRTFSICDTVDSCERSSSQAFCWMSWKNAICFHIAKRECWDDSVFLIRALRRSLCPLRIIERFFSSSSSSSVPTMHSFPLFLNAVSRTSFIDFVRLSAICRNVGTHFMRSNCFSIRPFTIKRSKAVCLSCAKPPVLWQWSKRLFASVTIYPAFTSFSLQLMGTSTSPCCNAR